MPESQDRVQGGGVPHASCISTWACQKEEICWPACGLDKRCTEVVEL